MRPPVDTPVLGRASRPPCADRVLNWRELLVAGATTARDSEGLAAELRTSHLVALCAADTGETKVDQAGLAEARRHVTVLHSACQLSAPNPPNALPSSSSSSLEWIFRRFLKYPLVTGAGAIRITQRWEGREDPSLPFHSEVTWLRGCLGWSVDTYATVGDAVNDLLALSDPALVVRPVTLVMMEWEGTATRTAPPALDLPDIPVPVRLVWVVARGEERADPDADAALDAAADITASRALEAEIQAQLAFTGWSAWDWQNPRGWAWDLLHDRAWISASAEAGFELLLHDRGYYPRVCRYAQKLRSITDRRILVPEGLCGW